MIFSWNILSHFADRDRVNDIPWHIGTVRESWHVTNSNFSTDVDGDDTDWDVVTRCMVPVSLENTQLGSKMLAMYLDRPKRKGWGVYRMTTMRKCPGHTCTASDESRFTFHHWGVMRADSTVPDWEGEAEFVHPLFSPWHQLLLLAWLQQWPHSLETL